MEIYLRVKPTPRASPNMSLDEVRPARAPRRRARPPRDPSPEETNQRRRPSTAPHHTSPVRSLSPRADPRLTSSPRPPSVRPRVPRRAQSENVCHFDVPRDDAAGYVNNQREKYAFRFDGVLGPDAKQDEVFERCAARPVLGALDGLNGTVFAYGQTGSGKTFTITGGAERSSTAASSRGRAAPLRGDRQEERRAILRPRLLRRGVHGPLLRPPRRRVQDRRGRFTRFVVESAFLGFFVFLDA